ncbi:CUB and sushi domain-containing protein 2-like isoform X2 [Halichondria panicea]|uniref:CUB and sushi domain-containing protein 2-like isoform X2 n=1 Tax=Halichondria panicea TaxID=6063 RepID=UPI00312BA192
MATVTLFLCCLLGSVSLVYGQDSVICPNVQLPPNGVVTYSDLTIPRAVGSTVTYSCVSGYEFSGGVPRTCTVTGWSNGGSPTCTVSCGSLDDPTNGRVMTTGTTLSNIATYTCNTGYTRSVDQTRVCQANGDWSGSEPVCNLICPNLGVPTNGGVTYSDTTIPRDEGSTATYTCTTHYQVTGLMMRMCTVSGWSIGDDPVCTVLCDDLTVPTNGVMISYSSSTSPHPQGTMATQSCVTGYTVLAGGGTRTCQSDRSWSGTHLTCTLICPNVGVPTNGVVTYSDPTIPRPIDSTVIYSCVVGYEFSGGVPRTCTASGWGDGGSPTCTVVSCGSLDDPINGRVTTTGTTLSNTATYTCNPGYTLSVDQTRVCQANGDWSGSEPSCNPVDCGSLTDPINGHNLWNHLHDDCYLHL